MDCKKKIDTIIPGSIIFGKAGIAQLVEYKLPKLGVTGSSPVARSTESQFWFSSEMQFPVNKKVGIAHFFI